MVGIKTQGLAQDVERRVDAFTVGYEEKNKDTGAVSSGWVEGKRVSWLKLYIPGRMVAQIIMLLMDFCPILILICMCEILYKA